LRIQLSRSTGNSRFKTNEESEAVHDVTKWMDIYGRAGMRLGSTGHDVLSFVELNVVVA